MAVISSVDEWWKKCNTNWENILDIFQKVGAPMGRDEEAHWWSERPGTPDVHHEKCLAQTLEDLRQAKNGSALHALLYLAWHEAPMNSWKWNGYPAFCDLISEDWVFDPTRNPEMVNVISHPSEGEAPEDAIWPQAHRPPS